MLTFIRKFFSTLVQKLGRVTTGHNFIGEIDGLRFLAILPVVFHHFSDRIFRITGINTPFEEKMSLTVANGHIGVYLFFAISGFILSLPFGRHSINAGPEVSLKKYFIRRLTRLEPPYLLIMTFFFFVLIIVKHQDFFELLPHYIASLFYAHRLIYGEWSPLNPPSWTLEVEIQFYILVPFLTIFYFSIKKLWARRSLLIGLMLAKILVHNLTTVLDGFDLTLPYVYEFFLVGILLADIYIVDWKDGVPRSKIFDYITVISIITLFSTWTWEKNLTWKFVFIFSLFMTIYGCFRSIAINRFFRNPWISSIGGMCYSIYLIHLALAEFFTMAFRRIIELYDYPVAYFVGIILFLPFLFFCSVIFFLMIEKPCMDANWPQKLSTRFKSVFAR
ncbi:acyltransferase family protein [Emticicia sp. CRIBPO]|uniref:acyltransferase family protein n=1 Tax=Emticicia sp. CRIBPO TaxID=2683258 RepID=UPI0014126D12|nr:acyltransferase [Emticicia sp. CRIBPO]NBA84581.1 acyltransferase family protein [Emticicia sp. CRIBPO]